MKLVFLHGFTGTPGSLRWVREALPPATQVLAPVLLGHAGGPSEASSFEAEVERLAALVDSQGFRGAHLLGYSLGSRVALGLLVRDPSQFTSATLVGVHPGLASDAAREQRISADQGWRDLLERQGLTAFIRAWTTLPLWDTQRALHAEHLRGQEQDRLSHSALGLSRALHSLGLGKMPAYSDRLYTLKLPVQLVVGELDHKFREIAGRMLPALPNATLHCAPGAGHNVLLEHPEFLAQVLENAAKACSTAGE